MAPPLSPDSSYYTIDGTDFTIRSNGNNDYDNIQTIGAAMDGVRGARLRWIGSHFFSDYVPVFQNHDARWEGQGRTVLQAGSSSGKMRPLDLTDRQKYQPNGVPDLVIFRESPTGGISTNVSIRGMGFETSALKGDVGLAFGFAPNENICVTSPISVRGKYGTTTEFDKAITLADTDSVPDANINDPISVTEFAEGLGTRYVEGVDFSVDRATGEFTRLGGGAILSGQTVYAHYNNSNNLNEVAHYRLHLEDVFFKGHAFIDANGARHSNVCDTGLWVRGDCSWVVQPSDDFIFVSYKYTTGDLAQHRWDKRVTRCVPLNGTLTMQNVSFEDMPQSFFIEAVDGIPTTNPYTYPADAVARSSVSMRKTRMKKMAIDNAAFYNGLLGNCSGTDLSMEDTVVTESAHVLTLEFLGLSQVQARRLATWDGPGCSLQIKEGGALGIVNEGPFPSPAIFLNSNAGAADDRLDYTIEKCRLGLSKLNPGQQAMIMVRRFGAGTLAENKLESEVPATSQGILIVDCDGTKALRNDFSGYEKASGTVDITVNSGSTDVELAVSPSDLIDDNGTDTVII